MLFLSLLVAATSAGQAKEPRPASPPSARTRGPSPRLEEASVPRSLRGRIVTADGEAPGPVALLLDRMGPIDPADSIAARATGATPRGALLDEVWVSFVPKVQVVAPGSTLGLSNHDSESHSVHARLGGATLFDVATVPGEPPRQVVLTDPGVVEITCDLHPEMRGFVVVTRAAHHAVSDREGQFVFEDLPRGRYRVRAFWGRAWSATRKAGEPGTVIGEVDSSGGPVSLRLPPLSAPPAISPVTPLTGPQSH